MFVGSPQTMGNGGLASGNELNDSAIPSGTMLVTRADTMHVPTTSGLTVLPHSSGRGSLSGAYGYGPNTTAYYANDTLNARISASTVISHAIPVTILSSPEEVFVSFDWFGSASAAVDDPVNLMRSETPYQIFKWGDLSLRLRAINNFLSGPSRCDWVYELFNGSTSLGTLTVPNVGTYSTFTHWQHFRIRAKLHTGNQGAFVVTIDGLTASFTGINTAQTTPIASATHIYIGLGALGRPTAISGPTFTGGCVDNILIDNQAFATFRPLGVRASLSSDATITGWVATNGGTLTNALTEAANSVSARGTGQGSRATFNPAAVTTTGFANTVLGFYHVLGTVNNIDIASSKRVRTGIELNAIPSYGSDVAGRNLPLSPSYISGLHDTIFYRANGAEYVLADLPQCRPLLEVL